MILAVIDCETGGFKPDEHELLEAFVLLVDDATWRVLAEAGGRIHPSGRRAITPQAIAVNGYDPELWRTTARPEFYVVGRVVAAAVQAEAWVGSNPMFDVRFLQAAARRLGFDFEPRQVYDVGVLGKQPGDRHKLGLDKLCERHGILTRKGPHGAREDCYRTLAVLPHVWRFR